MLREPVSVETRMSDGMAPLAGFIGAAGFVLAAIALMVTIIFLLVTEAGS